MTNSFSEFRAEAPALDAILNPKLRGVTAGKGAGVVGVSHAIKKPGSAWWQ